jgi:hypothetical protein
MVVAGKPIRHNQSSKASAPFLVSTNTSVKECWESPQTMELDEHLQKAFAQGAMQIHFYEIAETSPQQHFEGNATNI